MSVEVVMPQMGESITEGTVSKWLKAVGDKIDKDEAILEISTDKVDAEVPSPGAGVLLEIRHQEGETVEVGTVVAVIGAEGEQPAAVPSPKSQVPSQAEPTPNEAPAPVVEEISTEAAAQPLAIAAEQTPQSAIPNPQSGAATEVVMPQMGESITEGTVSKWLKSVGDKIDKDEPLLEISTDKVDAEVPSPAAGTLLEIRVNEGETVEVGSVVALVGAEGGAGVPSSKSQVPSLEGSSPVVEAPVPATPAILETPQVQAAAAGSSNGGQTVEDLRRTKSSPLVRNIAKEHGIDISRIDGSGVSGRVTKNDIMSFIETGAALRPQDLLVKSPVSPSSLVSQESKASGDSRNSQDTGLKTSAGDRVEKMSVMRKKIAEHMTFSKQTSAHVTSVYEIDMTNVAKFRSQNKGEFQSRYGTKLTYMPFIFQAVNSAIRKYPIINAQVDGENIVYKGDINLGMAVALDWGLLVPVIKKADTLSLSGLALAANDLADRARTKKLSPDEVTGGTFTITNPGVFGGLFGTPIINQPQVAILCVGTIEKRPKVFTSPEGDDYIAIRTMAYFALTYDHRIVDGADAEKFLAYMKEFLENGQFSY
jgi:pyruvate dehydrogenase E2 component (dihydrolipoamide acetyltransferase)